MREPRKFSTLGGVFTPSILTILGVIMYMRLGWVVGGAGSIGAVLLIILMAHIVSLSTGLSVSSVATDKKIEAGGIYYMLSRSLGLPIGGSIGITLFVATALSIALYLIGFAESAMVVLKEPLGIEKVTINHLRIVGSLALFVIVTIAYISTSIAIKSQYFILVAIALSLVSVFLGTTEGKEFDLSSVEEGELSFSVLFGVFFPAVTGFTAGVAMSGDLKDPKKSIPWGTMLAIFTGLVVYITLAIFIFYSIDQEILVSDKNALIVFGLVPGLVVAGIWGATLSSALGGILGGPRILQAMSSDKITPKIFAKGVGSENEPRNALILTFLIAELGILIGELDVIAEVVAMFYMSAYLFINISCFLEQWASPDFLPKFRIPLIVPLTGAIATFLLMIQLNLVASIVAIVIMIILFILLTRRQLDLGSGDVWQNVWYGVVKLGLKRLLNKKSHKRNWEPNIITFFEEGNKNEFLEFSQSISGKLGFISQFNFFKSSVLFSKQKSVVEDDETRSKGIFERKFYGENLFDGVENVAKYYGFSGIDPNTIFFDLDQVMTNGKSFQQLVTKLNKLDYNLLFLKYNVNKGFGNKKYIDVYWSDFSSTAEFTISLVRLLRQSNAWRNTEVRVIYVSDKLLDEEHIEQQVSKIFSEYRLVVEFVIINKQYSIQLIHEVSFESNLIVAKWEMDAFNEAQGYTELPTVLFIDPSNYFDEFKIVQTLNSDTLIEPIVSDESNEPISFLASGNKLLQELDINLKISRIPIELELLQVKKNHETFIDKLLIDFSAHDINNYNFLLIEKLNQRIKEFEVKKVIINELIINHIGKQDSLFKELPKKLLRSITEIDLAPSSYDSRLVKLKKWNLRYRKKWFGKRSISLNYRELVNYYFENYYLQRFFNKLPVFNQFNLFYFEGYIKLINKLIDSKSAIDFNIGDHLLDVKKRGDLLIKKLRKEIQQAQVDYLLKLDKELDSVDCNNKLEANIEKVNSRKNNLLKTKIYSFENKVNANKEILFEELKYRVVFIQSVPHIEKMLLEVLHIIKMKFKTNHDIIQDKITGEKEKSLLEDYLLRLKPIRLKIEKQTEFVKHNFNKLLEEIPDRIRIASEAEKNRAKKNADFVLKGQVVKLREVIQNLHADFLYTLTDEVINLERSYNQNILAFKSKIKLLKVTDFNDFQAKSKLLAQLHIDANATIENQKNRFNKFESIILDKKKQLFNAYKSDFINTSSVLSSTRLKQNGIIKFSKKIKGSATNFYDNRIQPVIEKGTNSVLLNKIQGNKLNDISAIKKAIDAHVLEAELHEKIPENYIKLFTKNTVSEDSLETRKKTLVNAKKYVSELEKKGGGLMIIGDFFSGRKSFSRYISSQFPEANTYEIMPGLSEVDSIENQFKLLFNSTDYETEIEKAQLSIFVFHHIETWFIEDQAMESIYDLYNKFNQKHIFIFNCSSWTYNYFDNQFWLNKMITRTIRLTPLNQKDFVHIMLEKHHAAGVNVKLFNKTGKLINNEKLIARKFYQRSNANIGVASLMWLGMITEFRENTVYLQLNNKIDLPEVNDSEWLMILKQLLLFGELTEDKLGQIFGNNLNLKRILNNIVQSGLIEERDNKFIIRPQFIFEIYDLLKMKRVI